MQKQKKKKNRATFGKINEEGRTDLQEKKSERIREDNADSVGGSVCEWHMRQEHPDEEQTNTERNDRGASGVRGRDAND